ncbi:MAG: glycosyltransferase family 4 protein [Anaerolineales bacterium]
MKVLLASHYTLPHRGGIETIIEKLSLGLATRNHQVRVVSSRVEGQEMFNSPNRQIIGVRAWDPLRRVGVHYPLFAPSLLLVLFRAVRWAQVVHVQGMLYQNSLLALLLGKLLRRPTVLTEHAGFVPYEQRAFNILQSIFVPILGRFSLWLSERVIVPDTIVQEILAARFPHFASKIVRIPLGVDTTLFHPVNAIEKQRLRSELGFDDRPKILFVGNFVARKRIPLLVEALPAECDLILCGEGTPPSNLPPNVFVYPPQGHAQLAKFYQAADLFVVPSSVETFAIAAYEAMACGLPVIMTQDLAHLTIKESGLVIFTPPNANDLHQTIQDLMQNEQIRTRLGEESAQWVKENYSWDAVVNRHIEEYQALLTLKGY